MKLRRFIKKPTKKIVIILVILGLLWFGANSFFFSWGEEKAPENIDIPKHLWETPVSKVEKSDLEVNINVLWKSKIVNEQELKFNQAWTITKASFKAWDSVKKGEILASMNKKDVYNEIEQAKLDLDNEKIKYNKLLEDNEDNNINLADSIKDLKRKISNLEAEIEELEISQKRDLLDKKADIKKAKNDLEKMQKLTPEEKEDLKRGLEKKEMI